MTTLSVNINKIALLRNARGKNLPDLIKAALDCIRFGAQGITVHPRPDERHIRYSDARELKPMLTVEFNIEGYPSGKFIELVNEIKPAQVTLVPDAPSALTSNAGWDTINNQSLLSEVIGGFKKNGIRTSLFVGTELKYIEGAFEAGADRIELYTEDYASHYAASPSHAIYPYREAARLAHKCGLGINAGHDLNLDNLAYFHKHIPHLAEVSIGHALLCDALYYGLENTIQMYRRQLG